MRNFPRPQVPEVPKTADPWFKVFRAQVGKRWSFICLADELLTCWVHWDPAIGRNLPCYGEGECSHCGPNNFRIWQGYMSAIDTNLNARFIVEVTRGLATKMKAEGLLNASLYGKQLTITRKEKKNSKNGAVVLVDHQDFRGQRKPARLDPLHSVLRCWAWNEEHYAILLRKTELIRAQAKQEIANFREAVPC